MNVFFLFAEINCFLAFQYDIVTRVCKTFEEMYYNKKNVNFLILYRLSPIFTVIGGKKNVFSTYRVRRYQLPSLSCQHLSCFPDSSVAASRKKLTMSLLSTSGTCKAGLILLPKGQLYLPNDCIDVGSKLRRKTHFPGISFSLL